MSKAHDEGLAKARAKEEAWAAGVPDTHTPGPWVANRDGDVWWVRCAAEGKSYTVAHVERSRPGYSSPRDRCDALLIAAAPDLLKVAEMLVAMEGMEFQTATREPLEALKRAHSAALDAITKATGRRP